MEKVKGMDSVAVQVMRGTGDLVDGATIKGTYDIEVWRDGELIHTQQEHNLVTTEGLRYLVDTGLGADSTYTNQTVWYGMVLSNDLTAAATFTYDAFIDTDGGTEFTSYSGGVRPTWTGVLDGSTASITNSASKISFSITGSGTLYGAALVSRNTLSDHTAGDYLLSYSKFSSGIAVVNTDVVKLTITITLS